MHNGTIPTTGKSKILSVSAIVAAAVILTGVGIVIIFNMRARRWRSDEETVVVEGTPIGSADSNVIIGKLVLFSKSLPSKYEDWEAGTKALLDKASTKLIFKFLGKEDVEPATRQKYGLILNDLATLKPYVTGILVPKDYIFPVTKDSYTDAQTTLVADAHKLGLEVYAFGFSNDFLPRYNYSYDLVNEYLQFIDNSQFSVDGVLTDFPTTASNSIACFSQSKNLTTRTVRGLIRSHNGASGDYPGSTDLAYQKAIDDGADIIDCTVQMSQDGVAFCSSNIDLTSTTSARATFVDRSSSVPEIQPTNGIFSFNVTSSEVESLRPTIEIPIKDGGLLRNQKNKNKGKLVTLDAFLDERGITFDLEDKVVLWKRGIVRLAQVSSKPNERPKMN